MKVSRPKFYALFYALFAAVLSSYLLPLYKYGDQEHYRDFYNYCFYDGYTFAQQYFCYNNTLSSQEPIYFILSKIAHFFVENKDYFIILSNFIFAYVLVLLILKYYQKVFHRHIFLALIFANYYFIVLLFSAERLKFSFIFLALALLISQKKRVVMMIVAMAAHTQILLLAAPYFISKIFVGSKGVSAKIAAIVVPSAAFSLIFYFLQDHIVSKLDSYSGIAEDAGVGIIGALKTSVFLILAFVSTRQIIPVVAGLPLVFAAYLMGSNRVGMLAFVLYVAAVLYYKRRMDFILFIVMLYFASKSYQFIYNIIVYGNGYFTP